MKHNMRLDRVRLVLCWLVATLSFGGLVPSHAADLELEVPKTIQGTVADLLARGSLAKERGELTTALQYYREAVESFDRQRPMMAEALLRLADNYSEVGALASAEEVYSRIVSEFSDQVAVVQRVPNPFRRELKLGNMSSIEQTLPREFPDGASLYGKPNRSSGKIDPKQEEMQVVLETAKRRLEKARSNVEISYHNVLEGEIRLRISKGATPLGIPGSVRPGGEYSTIKERRLEIFRTMTDSKAREQRLAKVEEQAQDWIQSVFVPSLEAELDAAVTVHEEWQVRYEHEFDRYRDLLRKYQSEQEKEANRRAEEAAELAKQNEMKRIVVIGKVKSPGFYEVPSNMKITVLQAIAIAGGFEGNANTSKLQIKRSGEVLRVSLKDEMEKIGADQFLVKSEDTIIVSESIF